MRNNSTGEDTITTSLITKLMSSYCEPWDAIKIFSEQCGREEYSQTTNEMLCDFAKTAVRLRMSGVHANEWEFCSQAPQVKFH